MIANNLKNTYSGYHLFRQLQKQALKLFFKGIYVIFKKVF